MRVLACRIFGLFSLGFSIPFLSGCGGSGETIQGRISYLGKEGDEFVQEGVSLKVFDQLGALHLRDRAEVELGKLLLGLNGDEVAFDFLETFFSALFAIIDTTPALEELETDDEGRFDFSYSGNEFLVAAQFVVEDENPRWLKFMRRDSMSLEEVDLRAENQLKFGGAREFLALEEIEGQFNRRIDELALVAEWKPKLQHQNLRYIPPGTFMMGSRQNDLSAGSDEIPHEVTITHGFWMGKHEVTYKKWNTVWGVTDVNASMVDVPVTQVSYGRAQAFCWRLTEMARRAGKLPSDLIYRLPTEAEWEYACRAGTDTAFSFDDDGALLSEYSWHQGNSARRCHKVGLKNANAWGLHDMHGNVLEWCFDWYGTYPPSPVVNPLGALRGRARVLRGGSFAGDAFQCSSSIWDKWTPISRSDNVGFRVVLGYPL